MDEREAKASHISFQQNTQSSTHFFIYLYLREWIRLHQSSFLKVMSVAQLSILFFTTVVKSYEIRNVVK